MAKILLADDDINILRTQCAVLTRAGHEVVAVNNGRKVMRCLEASNDFDLLITDIVMPEAEGMETIRAVRKLNQTLKIIAMSGGGSSGQMDYLTIAKGLGANLTLHKPFSGTELLEAVASLIKPGS